MNLIIYLLIPENLQLGQLTLVDRQLKLVTLCDSVLQSLIIVP